MTKEQKLEILKQARRRVKKGWCQHTLINSDNPRTLKYCVVGAIVYDDEVGYRRWEDWTMRLVAEVEGHMEKPLAKKSSNRRKWTHLVNWNNNSQRRQEEVVALFDRAIGAYKKEKVK